MDYKRIEWLLNKFWQCQTTVEEENELRQWFDTGEKLPEHLQQFREIFVVQVQEKQVSLTEDFDRKILSEIGKKRIRRPSFSIPLLRVAVVIMLLVVAGGVFLWQQNKCKSDKQAREQALIEVRQALAFVSLKLNRGQQIVEKNMEEMKIVTQFIKE